MPGSPVAGAQRSPSLGPSAARTNSQKQRRSSASRSPHNALRRARRTQCPNARGSYIWSLSTDRASEIACGRWDCSWCQWRKRAAACVILQVGLEVAWARRERVRFLTLTDGSKGKMTVADFYAAWNRLRVGLARERKGGAYMNEYAAVVKVQKRGALHLHVLMTGRYVPQRKLVGMAMAAGFGRCTDIREVRRVARDGAKGSAEYVTKQLAGYLTKQSATALSAKTNERRRPIRTSRGWGGGMTMRRAMRMMADAWLEDTDNERDTGPFAFVQALSDGDVLVRLGQEWHRFALPNPPAAEHAEPTTDDDGATPPGGAMEEEREGGAAQVGVLVGAAGAGR
jgi:hypothetical protein